MKTFFKYLNIEELIKNNPAELLESPKIGRKLPDTLSVDEINQLIQTIDRSTNLGERNITIIEVLYGCGLRVSELINLKISEIYWEEGFIRVIGKGSKQRLVPLGSVAVKHLKIYLKEIRIKLKINPSAQDIVFLNRRGNKLTRVMIFTIIKQLAEKANIKKFPI